MNNNTLIPELRFPEFENDNGWVKKPLDEICTLVRGPFGGALKKEIFVNDGFAVYEQSHAIYSNFHSFRYRINEEKYKELKRFSVKPGDLIMSCSGTMGKFAMIPKNYEKGVINQALLKLTAKKGYDNLFVKISLETEDNQNKLLSQSAGGAIKNVVAVSQIRELAVAVPSSQEQQKISECLSSLDEGIEANIQRLELLNDHKRGLMQKLLPQEGETIPKYRFPEFVNDGKWEKKSLIATANKKVKWSFTGGPFGSNLKAEDYTPTGVRIIQLQNIGDGAFNDDNKIFTSHEKADELISCNIYAGEIIISKMGDPVGRACIIPEYLDRSVMASDGIRLAIDEEKFSKYFIYSLINSKQIRQAIEKKSTGSTRKRIGLETLREVELILPKSIKEQNKIASCLSELDELIKQQSKKIVYLKLHKKGLMQNLFPKMND